MRCGRLCARSRQGWGRPHLQPGRLWPRRRPSGPRRPAALQPGSRPAPLEAPAVARKVTARARPTAPSPDAPPPAAAASGRSAHSIQRPRDQHRAPTTASHTRRTVPSGAWPSVRPSPAPAQTHSAHNPPRPDWRDGPHQRELPHRPACRAAPATAPAAGQRLRKAPPPSRVKVARQAVGDGHGVVMGRGILKSRPPKAS